MVLRWIGIFCLAMGFGCSSSGFHREQWRAETKEMQNTSEEVQKLLALKPQLPSPFRLGVVFKDPQGDVPHPKFNRWTGEEKMAVMGQLELLIKSHGLVFEVQGEGDEAGDTRLLAAKMGADGVLELSLDVRQVSVVNSWGWSYLLVLPAFLAPGNDVYSFAKSRLKLRDVRNDFLYLGAAAEADLEEARSLFFPRFQESYEKVRKLATERLLEEFRRQWHSMIGSKEYPPLASR